MPGDVPGGIDRNSYEPAYIQIARIVSEEIADGILHAGDQLPSEAQFRARFKVSPMTIRRAINILVEKSLVRTIQGKGTFVRSLDMGEAVFRLQELRENRSDTSVKLLEAGIISIDDRVAGKLAISPGHRGIYIRRLILGEGIPAVYHREYLIYDPSRPIVEAQLQITSLAGLLQGEGAPGLRRGSLIMEAINLNEEDAAILHVPPQSAAFSLEHLFYDFEDHPISWGWFIYRADQFRLTARIGAGAEL